VTQVLKASRLRHGDLRFDIAVEARVAAEAGKRSNVAPIGKHGERRRIGPEGESGSANSLEELVRPPRFERGTFSSGGENGEKPTTPDDSSE